jgi:hypothetical protein
MTERSEVIIRLGSPGQGASSQPDHPTGRRRPDGLDRSEEAA